MWSGLSNEMYEMSNAPQSECRTNTNNDYGQIPYPLNDSMFSVYWTKRFMDRDSTCI